MNEAHWHLAVNHLPIIMPIAGLLTLLSGWIFKSDAVRKTAYLLFVVAAISAAVSMSTGEGAEETIEEMPGIEHSMIHEHEEAAEGLAAMLYALGVVSVVGIWAETKKTDWARWIPFLTLILALVALYMARQTGTSGGEIRHTEIRSGFVPQKEGAGAQQQENTEED